MKMLMRALSLCICIILYILTSLQSYCSDLDKLYSDIKKESNLSTVELKINEYEKLALSSNSWGDLAKAYFLVGYKYKHIDRFGDAFDYYNKCLVFAIKADDPLRQAKTYENLGKMYFETFYYKTAESYYLKALKINQSLNDKFRIARSYRDIGISLRKQDKQIDAIDWYTKAQKAFTEIDSKKNAAQMMIEIGICYVEVESYQNAKEFYDYALGVSTSNEIQANVLNNLSYINWQQGDTSKAISNAKESLKIKTAMNKSLVPSYNNLGIYYFEMKRWDSAITYFQKSLEFNTLKELNGASMQNHSEAMAYVDSISSMNSDLILSQSLLNRCIKLNAMFSKKLISMNQKQKQMELNNRKHLIEDELMKKNIQYWVYIAAFSLILLSCALYYRFTKEEVKKKKVRQVQADAQIQLNRLLNPKN